MEIIRERMETQQSIQNMVAPDASLDDSLYTLCKMHGRDAPGALSTVMLFEQTTQTLRLKAHWGLPAGCLEAMQEIPVGPDIGACGSTAFYREFVVTEDIWSDPHWGVFRGVARAHGLHACWSYPVLSRDGQLLGTFASYYRQPGSPTRPEIERLARVAGWAALLIERHRSRQALIESEQRYRSLFTHHPDGVFTLDRDGFFTSVNQAGTTLMGLAADEVIGMHYLHCVDPRFHELTIEAFDSAKQGKPIRFETQILNAEDERHIIDITNIPIEIDETIVGVYGIVKDITYRKTREAHLRILQRSVEASVNGIVITDAEAPNLPVVYANPPFLRTTGYALDEVLGHNCRFLQGPDTDPQALAKLRHRIKQQREVNVTLRNYRKDGTPFWNDLHISPVRDDEGCVTHFVGVMHDISEHKANEARLAYYASHDPLTGLPHRTLLSERLAHDYQLTLRSQSLLAVVCVDLDDFKPVNDSLGHTTGDEVLKIAASRLEALLTPGDTLARVGGDEFIMLLPGLENEDQALMVVERALTLLAKPYHIDGHELYVTGSIGIATNQEPVAQPTELLQRADMAMYRAKRSGRNTYHWFTQDITSLINERVALRRDLQEAIEEQQFTLHYQPLVSAEKGRAIGFEALIRWQHPTQGIISPAVFIPLAEHTGQIITIGQWVIERACRDLVAINASLGRQYTMAVNISPLQFRRKGFLARLRDVLEATKLPPHLLEVEITEGVLMEDTEAAIETLHDLRSMGVGVALDDFGTGFSSLSYLRHLPINKVKIDRSFVKDITNNRHDAAIAQGVIKMAHDLGLNVVAEGIETEEQRETLMGQACDLFQGYLLARPMPLEGLKEYLARPTD